MTYWVVSFGDGNQSDIAVSSMHTKKSDKTKRVNTNSYRERLEKLGLTILLERRIRDDLIETFKIIHGISNYGGHFFQYFSSNWEFTTKADFKN